MPTPAFSAISRTGASTPDVANTARAASSNASSLRCASARTGRSARPRGSNASSRFRDLPLKITSCKTERCSVFIRNIVPIDWITRRGRPGHTSTDKNKGKTMQYRTLGRTGIKVSSYCLGAMMFGQRANPDHDECVRMIHRALDADINFIDTADAYSGGDSEEIVGKALKGRRDNVVLATKAFLPMGDDQNQRGSSRRWLTRAIDN